MSKVTEKAENTAEDANVAAAADVEGGIRDIVRLEHLRGPMSASTEKTAKPADEPRNSEATVAIVNSLIQRLAGTSVADIESLITELESLRDLLHAEGQRVQREISAFAQLCQAAMKSTSMIADNVAQWKGAAGNLLKI
ncbi:MAG: hypothetical protein ABIO35_09130 [Nitrobacter sp.]